MACFLVFLGLWLVFGAVVVGLGAIVVFEAWVTDCRRRYREQNPDADRWQAYGL